MSAVMKPRSGGENPEFILQDFGGMSNLAGREAINDNDFWWIENVIPVAAAAAYPVRGPSPPLVTVAAENGAPSYSMSFNAGGVSYAFAVWKNSGRGYVVNLTTFVATQIISGLTSGQTAAAQWNNLGLLIVDPSGFWDWNVTTANTLTSQNNSVAALTAQYNPPASIPWNTTFNTPAILVSSGAGAGATFQITYQVTTVTINAAGTGYAVGDIIFLTTGSGSGLVTAPAQIVVTTIGGGGSVTGISLQSGGVYTLRSTDNSVGPLTAGATTTSGAGTGANFGLGKIQATGITILTRGHGYANGDTVFDQPQVGAGPIYAPSQKWTITASGVASGTTIATYATRAWIGSGRTVAFTDVNSYNSFGGAGGAFTITDSYLVNTITALVAANNYLYIFGDKSIDALSNVIVSGGVTGFTRINITAAVGTSQPSSVFPYFRSLAFYHATGFYLLSGATPEKLSGKISGVVQAIQTSAVGVYGGTVAIQAELCACFLFTFNDTFSVGATSTGNARAIFALFFRGRWWAMSFANLTPQAMLSVPVAGLDTLYAWAGNALYQAFSPIATLSAWQVRTRLWSANAPLHEKQAINAAFAGVLNGQATLGIALYVDTELASFGPTNLVFSQALEWINSSGQVVNWVNALNNPVQWVTSPIGYDLVGSKVTSGSSQYLGLSVTGTGNNEVTKIDLLALRGKQDRNMLT